MNIDLKLYLESVSPAPWNVISHKWDVLTSGPTGDISKQTLLDNQMTRPDMVMCAMARNFLDIVMRRGWGVIVHPDGWGVDVILPKLRAMRWPDPFTAVQEAEKWWVANMGEKVNVDEFFPRGEN